MGIKDIERLMADVPVPSEGRPARFPNRNRLPERWREAVRQRAGTNIDDAAWTSGETENVGLQVRSLRQCCLSKRSLPPWRDLQKRNNGGLFAPDLLTGLDAERAQKLSLRLILSKPDDFRI